MPWTESEHKKGVIDNLRGPDVSLYCVQGQELGCVWCRDMISAELCNWLRVFIIISPGPVHLQTLDIPRTIIRHYQPLRLVNSQHAGYSIASASDVASHKSWSWYSHHDTKFVLSNLCRLYCYNLNNSINIFSAKQVLLFYIVDNLFVEEREKYFFSWKIINKIALRVFEFTTCLFCKLSNLRLTSKWPPTSKKPRWLTRNTDSDLSLPPPQSIKITSAGNYLPHRTPDWKSSRRSQSQFRVSRK